MGSLRTYVGARIRQLRQAAGLTQDQLGSMAKIDGKVIGDYERGDRNATLDSLEKILMALGISDFSIWKLSPELQASASTEAEKQLVRVMVRTDKTLDQLRTTIRKAISGRGSKAHSR